MLRIPVRGSVLKNRSQKCFKSSSAYIRSSFIEYFINNYGHKHIKSSSVVPLCDPTVPFVNAGMNQFKGVFLGIVEPLHPKAVNSQKCVRVGGKHNDLDLVGVDGHHHTFFEMLGNWSFGVYYKKKACKMAWDLLLGPYRLKPEKLLVTYFAGDPVIGLTEDRECRDIWKEIGVPGSRIRSCDAKDNFWEMGECGPCGPCTEIHYINPDGSLTELWNIVFIQCNRDASGKVVSLRRQHVDTGMGLERMSALLQEVPSNYDTDLFVPIITSIQKNSKNVNPYGGSYKVDATLDQAYRRLADHSRMISVCLADGVFPATSINLKQIMRKSFRMCSEVFQNPNLMNILYDEVTHTLGDTYPELVVKEKDAKLILNHERESYAKLRSNMAKKWKELVTAYPEVEVLSDVELAGFSLGYREFKEMMNKQKTNVIPGELVFKLYDTHGFQEETIEQIAKLNNYDIDKRKFWNLLAQHKSRHKTSFKEQTTKQNGALFDQAVETLIKNNSKVTDDSPKYDYVVNNQVVFKPLKTKLVAILNQDAEWIDYLDACEDRPYYLVTESTNFYTEAGGQVADTGVIYYNDMKFIVDSVFKIRDYVFHKGCFKLSGAQNYINNNSEVVLSVDSERRLSVMRNHTGVHLLNAALRKVLPSSVLYQTSSSVSDKGFSLTLAVYGEKLSHKVIMDAQELVRESIKSNAQVETRTVDSTHLSSDRSIVTVPGETYPETGLRLVTCQPPLVSKELCCGSHVPCSGLVGEVCVTRVRAAGTHSPTVHAITGDFALQARELFCRAEKLSQVIELADVDRVKQEVGDIKRELAILCGQGGAPWGEYAQCLTLLDTLQKKAVSVNDAALNNIAEVEITEAVSESARLERRFVVHFLRCSYLMQPEAATRALATGARTAQLPALLVGCAGGVIVAVATLPKEMVTETFTAGKWLRCILPIFKSELVSGAEDQLTHAQMNSTKVSLINCELLVQDAMRVAVKFAQAHSRHTLDDTPRETRANT